MKKPCCQDESNLQATVDPDRPDITVRTCQVCGARHITMKADPGRIGLRGSTMGKPPLLAISFGPPDTE